MNNQINVSGKNLEELKKNVKKMESSGFKTIAPVIGGNGSNFSVLMIRIDTPKIERKKPIKPIKVIKGNEEKINLAFKQVEGKAKERTCTAQDVFKAVEKIERKFNIPKKYMNGLLVKCDIHAQKFPNAYKYAPESTQFHLKNINGNWYVYNISRNNCNRSNQKGFEAYFISDEIKAALLKKYEKFEA